VAEELELAWVREALQTRLLVELMSNAMHKELVLKGGMAMRAVHGSVRYTKDIDLDADERASKERIQGVVRRSIERAVSSGLIANATVTTPKQTDTTLRWKIAGTQPNSSAPMHLTVEVSRRPKLIEGHVVEVALDKAFNRTGRDVKIQVLDSQHIAVTKVLALTDPMRMAPRDLFDLNVLLEAGVKDPGPLLAQLSDAQLRLPLLMAELWPKIEAMSYEQFRNDVVPYLPTTVGLAIDSEAFETMRVDVGVAVERWLQSAASLWAES
jgi:predicted nucleotidyltransferase component of viral defense system